MTPTSKQLGTSVTIEECYEKLFALIDLHTDVRKEWITDTNFETDNVSTLNNRNKQSVPCWYLYRRRCSNPVIVSKSKTVDKFVCYITSVRLLIA